MPRRPSLPVPSVSDVPQRECARGLRCEARTRDTDGGWHPARSNSAFCPACAVRVEECAAGLPVPYALLAAGVVARSGRRLRVPPGPRVPLNVMADALAREAAAVTAGWAARLRSLLSLSPSRRGHGTPERVRDDCLILAKHRVPLLALPDGPTARVYPWPLSPEEEERLAGCDLLRVGEDWARVMEPLDGTAAGLEVVDLHERAMRLTGHTPAPPDLLDGIPCRACEAMSSLEVIPQEPPDPQQPEPAWCRCTVPSCRDEMTRAEYEKWTGQYAAWAAGAGVVTCLRCERGACGDCCWRECGCAARGHKQAA